mmetsp:Transcript_68694/g.223642  ORF Transcript_68694/g.223642 Transcript_68694/m.223642 type:complete len:103 (+) Transcript_68694:1032-1340(+)
MQDGDLLSRCSGGFFCNLAAAAARPLAAPVPAVGAGAGRGLAPAPGGCVGGPGVDAVPCEAPPKDPAAALAAAQRRPDGLPWAEEPRTPPQATAGKRVAFSS